MCRKMESLTLLLDFSGLPVATHDCGIRLEQIWAGSKHAELLAAAHLHASSRRAELLEAVGESAKNPCIFAARASLRSFSSNGASSDEVNPVCHTRWSSLASLRTLDSCAHFRFWA